MRLFIGIALDDALRVQLRREAEALLAHMRGNFSLPANYHVTLAFLGQHEESEIPAIRAAIDAASARCQFDIGIGGLGSFKKAIARSYGRALITQMSYATCSGGCAPNCARVAFRLTTRARTARTSRWRGSARYCLCPAAL